MPQGQQSQEQIELKVPVNMITAFGVGSSEQSCAGNECAVCIERYVRSSNTWVVGPALFWLPCVHAEIK